MSTFSSQSFGSIPDDPFSSSLGREPRPSKRQKTRCAQACSACAFKKVKCSGIDPCERCVKAGRVCFFKGKKTQPESKFPDYETKGIEEVHPDETVRAVASKRSGQANRLRFLRDFPQYVPHELHTSIEIFARDRCFLRVMFKGPSNNKPPLFISVDFSAIVKVVGSFDIQVDMKWGICIEKIPAPIGGSEWIQIARLHRNHKWRVPREVGLALVYNQKERIVAYELTYTNDEKGLFRIPVAFNVTEASVNGVSCNIQLSGSAVVFPAPVLVPSLGIAMPAPIPLPASAPTMTAGHPASLAGAGAGAGASDIPAPIPPPASVPAMTTGHPAFLVGSVAATATTGAGVFGVDVLGIAFAASQFDFEKILAEEWEI